MENLTGMLEEAKNESQREKGRKREQVDTVTFKLFAIRVNVLAWHGPTKKGDKVTRMSRRPRKGGTLKV